MFTYCIHAVLAITQDPLILEYRNGLFSSAILLDLIIIAVFYLVWANWIDGRSAQ